MRDGVSTSLVWWLVGGAAALSLGRRLLPDVFDKRSGSVVDSVTGAPIAGVTVVASWSGFTDFFRNQHAVAHVQVAVTDAQGRWRLGGWAAGRDSKFRKMRVDRWVAVPGRPGGTIAVSMWASTTRLPPVAQGDDPRGTALRDAFVLSKAFGSLAFDGSGTALVPLQLALIAEIEQLEPTQQNLEALAWAREGVAATRRSAGAGDRSPSGRPDSRRSQDG